VHAGLTEVRPSFPFTPFSKKQTFKLITALVLGVRLDLRNMTPFPPVLSLILRFDLATTAKDPAFVVRVFLLNARLITGPPPCSFFLKRDLFFQRGHSPRRSH